MQTRKATLKYNGTKKTFQSRGVYAQVSSST